MNLGLTTEIHEIEVIDADTVRVRVIKEIDIRLMPDEGRYDAPEIFHHKSPEEKQRGLEAKEYLEDKIKKAEKENIVVYIPFGGRGKVKDISTLGRVLGKVYINDENIIDKTMLEKYRK